MDTVVKPWYDTDIYPIYFLLYLLPRLVNTSYPIVPIILAILLGVQ
ncbi:hypothetical protein D0Z68_00835 [Rickettsia japonica]|uniref:Uncharacterized protein n=1 Tax=Rickettsia japonica TaxID=35790 RepID=A0ABM6YF57_RICJA|nr:hypothetical protein D0Z68_00835 [Rickettsia japonica]